MAKKKTTKKKTPARKKVAKKKSAKKKTAKKKSVAKKVVKKKALKKKTAKKTAAKKTAAKKTTAKKSAAKKAPAKKKSASKKSTKNKTTKKTTAKKPTPKPLAKTTKKPIKPKAPPPPPPMTPDQRLAEDMEKDWTIPKLKRVKTGLSKKELNEYLQLLLEKRAEIIGSVQGMEDARNAALGDIAHMPLHMADVGSDNFEQEFTLGLMESERQMLREIEEAILRMREGYYGVCLDSGRPIDKMRLEFAPWAKYCIEVARLREKRGW